MHLRQYNECMKYNNIPERDIKIDLPDGKKIHGILRGSLTDGSPVIVMMHGLPGEGNELLQYLGARYLYDHGFSTLRLYMYDFGQEYRDLLDCTLETHIADFETVVQYLRDNAVGKVFALGHSYGGITILGSKVQLDAAVMWDASHGLAWQDQDPRWTNDFPEVSYQNMTIGVAGQGYVMPRLMDENNKKLGDNTEWAAHKGYPIKFITAGEGMLVEYARHYYEVADEPKAYVIIEGASHQLDDSDDIMEQLFHETSDWFDLYR